MSLKKTIPFFAIIALLLSTSSCKLFQPVSLLPTFSAAVIQDKTDLGKQVDLMYTIMEQSEDKDYATYLPDYNSIEVLINSIITRDQVRNKNALIVKQDNLYRDMFLQFQREHKAKGSINDSEIRTYKLYLRAQLKPLLVAEKSLK